MRLSSFLPMLLLWAGSLTAQSNCQIFDLTATVVQFDPVTCQYFVVLDFQHTGTTNLFIVKGNGTLFGSFEYGQLPLVLGPFSAGANAQTQLEFAVQDAVFLDCGDNVVIQAPNCTVVHNCDITDLSVDVGDCFPLLNAYTVTIDFNVTASTNDFFEVFTDGGVSLGLFPTAALPLTIPMFPWGGGAVDLIKVCINDNPDCCESIEFNAPTCFNQNCGSIIDLNVLPGDCISDSTYKALINFAFIITTPPSDSFTLYLDGNLQGTFGINQLPLPVVFESNDSTHSVAKVCVDLINGGVCCVEKAFELPGCLAPCAIHDLSVQVDSCTSDSTFGVWVNFTVNDTTAVDSFSLSGNGHFIGNFGMDQLPLHLDSFQWNGLIFNNIRVCTGNSPFCCKEFVFLAPLCLPFDSCEVTTLVAIPGPCTSDSTYKLVVHFNATNPGDGRYVFTNQQTGVSDTLSLTQVPLFIDDFPVAGPNGHISVCILDSTNQTGTGCCKSIEFQHPNCSQPCDIANLHVQVGDCDSTGNAYALTIDFDALHPGNDSFDLYANGQFFGTYALSQLPLVIPHFPASGNAFDHIKVCIQDHPDCCAGAEFQAPNCGNQDCEIFDLSVQVGDCNPVGGYAVTINFGVHNPGNDSFDLYANGTLIGTFSLNLLPLHLPNFPASGNPIDVIKVCINDQPNCCKAIEFQAPNCNPDCEIFDLTVQTGDCNPLGGYAVTINFGVHNPGNDSFDLYGNGQLLGTFPLNQLPLTIPNFPGSGNPIDVIKVCINDQPNCCKAIEFQAPNCNPDCEIYDLHVEVGDCNPAGGYAVTVNFGVHNPGNDSFDLYANGQLFGTYQLNQLPLHIPNFPASGNAFDVIKVCINDQPDCCKTIEFQAPNCNPDCEIFDLQVQVGDCNPAGGYAVTVNFGVHNPGNDFFQLYANGTLLGTFPLNQLPLTIPNFPASGNAFDVIKVCINDHPDCCKAIEFQAPNCNPDCDIFDLAVQTGDCNPLGGYSITINFGVNNPGSDFFNLYANGQFIGIFNLNLLPLTLPSFPGSGNAFDHIKVCIDGSPNCCADLEFQAPNCNPGCDIFDLHVEVGDCNQDGTYHITVNFGVHNPGNDLFDLYANGQLFGTYALNQLPLHIPNFPAGVNLFAVIKVCINDHPDCCEVTEFQQPNCDDCEITNLHVEVGPCTSDSSYVVTFTFQANNPPANLFGVWANGQFLGMYGLGQLPVVIQNFPWDGGTHDVIKVCFNPNNTAQSCCAAAEFAVPDCLLPGDCEIFDMVADPGDCTSDSTYSLVLNFQVHNPPGNLFGVWANNQFLGTFNLNQLPLSIPNFPWDGGNADFVKVCFVNNAGTLGCCKTIEYQVPDCLLTGGDCEIFGMVVDPGDCTGDSTYNLFLNFQVHNPLSNMFGVWANNGQFLGFFNLNQLPLNIMNFPWNGGVNDVIKVCFVGNNGSVGCCRTLEFAAPDCVGGSGNCHIWDVLAVRTECLCGQFFVAITFHHDNGGNGGFDLVGNGHNYGNYPYNYQQPIILGPFPGDATTVYEFGVADHDNPDCEDGFVLGTVECSSFVHEPGGNSSLTISPNPASGWVNVTATLASGISIGQADIDIYHADGRLVLSQTVANASSFLLDVTNLPAGVYRLAIKSGSGHLDGSFTKQ